MRHARLLQPSGSSFYLSCFLSFLCKWVGQYGLLLASSIRRRFPSWESPPSGPPEKNPSCLARLESLVRDDVVLRHAPRDLRRPVGVALGVGLPYVGRPPEALCLLHAEVDVLRVRRPARSRRVGGEGLLVAPEPRRRPYERDAVACRAGCVVLLDDGRALGRPAAGPNDFLHRVPVVCRSTAAPGRSTAAPATPCRCPAAPGRSAVAPGRSRRVIGGGLLVAPEPRRRPSERDAVACRAGRVVLPEDGRVLGRPAAGRNDLVHRAPIVARAPPGDEPLGRRHPRECVVPLAKNEPPRLEGVV